jgi:hypothetical protein
MIPWCVFVSSHQIELTENTVSYSAFLRRKAVIPLSEIFRVESGRVKIGGKRFGTGQQAIRITIKGERSKDRKSIIMNARLFSDADVKSFLTAFGRRGIPVKVD